RGILGGLDRSQGFLVLRINRPCRAGGHAAGAHDVQAPEHVGMLHADPAGAITAHRVTHQPAACPLGYGAVMRIDICDHIVRDEALEIARGHRTRIHRSVVHGLRIRQDDDHLLSATGLAPGAAAGSSVLTGAAAHSANPCNVGTIWCLFISLPSIENRNHLSDPAPVRDDRPWLARESLEPPHSDAWPRTGAA